MKDKQEFDDDFLSFDEVLSKYISHAIGTDVDENEEDRISRKFLYDLTSSLFEYFVSADSGISQDYRIEKERKILDEQDKIIDVDEKIRVSVLDDLYLRSPLMEEALKLQKILQPEGYKHENGYRLENIIGLTWEHFSLADLNWRHVIKSRFIEKADIPNWMAFLDCAELFPNPKSSFSCIEGNKTQGFYAGTSFNWEEIDFFLSRVAKNVRHSQIFSFSLLHYRIASETWKYNFDCINSFGDNGGFAFSSDNAKRALDNHYSWKRIIEKSAFSKAKWFVVSLVMVSLSGGFLWFFGKNSYVTTMESFGWWLLVSPFLLYSFLIFLWIVKFILKNFFLGDVEFNIFKPKVYDKLKKRDDLIHLCAQFDRCDVDIEGSISDLRNLLKQNVALPTVLISILKYQLDSGNYNFDEMQLNRNE